MSDIPVLPAYSVPPALLRTPKFARREFEAWLVPCDFCGRVHLHGAGEGYRQSHCPVGLGAPKYEKAPPPMYELKFAGEAPPEIIARVAKPKRRRKTTCSH